MTTISEAAIGLAEATIGVAAALFYGALVLVFVAWWTLLPTIGLFWMLGVLR